MVYILKIKFVKSICFCIKIYRSFLKVENKLWGVIKDSRREKFARLLSGSEAFCMFYRSGL